MAELLLLATLTTSPSLSEPPPAYQICFEMESEIWEGVKFGIITEDEANHLLLRCLVNYS